jgi:hypothetical protein
MPAVGASLPAPPVPFRSRDGAGCGAGVPAVGTLETRLMSLYHRGSIPKSKGAATGVSRILGRTSEVSQTLEVFGRVTFETYCFILKIC